MDLALRWIPGFLACAAACGCAGVSVGESGDGESPCVSQALVPVTDLSQPVGDFDRSPEELLARVEGTAHGTFELFEEIDGAQVHSPGEVSFRISVRPVRDSLQFIASEPIADFDGRCPDELSTEAEIDIDFDGAAQLRLRDRGTLDISSSSSSIRFRVVNGFETDLVAHYEDGPAPGEDAALLGSLQLDETGTEWSAEFFFKPIRPCTPDDYLCSDGLTIDDDREEALLGEGRAWVERAMPAESASQP